LLDLTGNMAELTTKNGEKIVLCVERIKKVEGRLLFLIMFQKCP